MNFLHVQTGPFCSVLAMAGTEHGCLAYVAEFGSREFAGPLVLLRWQVFPQESLGHFCVT